MGSPPKPGGGSRGFGGESRSSAMRELSPSGGSEGYGACDDEGVRNEELGIIFWVPAVCRGAHCAPAPSFRGPGGAVGIRFSLDGETDCRVGPAALLAMTKNEPVCRRTFPLGGRWPAGPDEGATCPPPCRGAQCAPLRKYASCRVCPPRRANHSPAMMTSNSSLSRSVRPWR